MIYDQSDNLIFETTGKKIYAHCGIIGLSEELRSVYDGYDGIIETSYHDDDESLTVDERKELADYMIAIWTRYAAEGLTG